MPTEIKRKRSAGKIAGMEPPPDTIGALNKEWKQNKAFLEGNRKSSEQIQMNVRILQAQIDALVLRLRELEDVNEVLPDEFDDSNIEATLKDLQDQIDAIGIPPDEGGTAGTSTFAGTISSVTGSAGSYVHYANLYPDGYGGGFIGPVELSHVMTLSSQLRLAASTDIMVIVAGSDYIGQASGVF